jgi:hypothetical protein
LEDEVIRAYVLGFIVGLALLIVAGVAGFQSDKKSSEERKYQRELQIFNEEIVDATPAQLGVTNERQRMHSRIFSTYRNLNSERISDLLASTEGKVVGKEFYIGLSEVITEPQTPENYFGELTQASDAVIRGRVIKKQSQVTEDETFIFTDYEVMITEVFKDNVSSPLDTSSVITITRPGGKIVIDNRVVKVKDHYFEPLPTNNEVVLFLKYLPETGAYKAARSTGSFELKGSKLRPLTGEQFPPGVIQGSSSFLRTIRSITK